MGEVVKFLKGSYSVRTANAARKRRERERKKEAAAREKAAAIGACNLVVWGNEWGGILSWPGPGEPPTEWVSPTGARVSIEWHKLGFQRSRSFMWSTGRMTVQGCLERPVRVPRKAAEWLSTGRGVWEPFCETASVRAS